MTTITVTGKYVPQEHGNGAGRYECFVDGAFHPITERAKQILKVLANGRARLSDMGCPLGEHATVMAIHRLNNELKPLIGGDAIVADGRGWRELTVNILISDS